MSSQEILETLQKNQVENNEDTDQNNAQSDKTEQTKQAEKTQQNNENGKSFQNDIDNDDINDEVLDVTNKNQTKMRTIGRWFIGETLGKGGYSWVKKGFDKKTGKCVALKFMAKADNSWLQEQSKQVVTEIEALKQIRHPNVMKLYAYNLNAKYPTKGNEKMDTILLVLEYAPGGELFDILYYTSALEPIVARTYFRQMLLGLEACHNAGIAHRDMKPQNLLLDSRFNLKLTDFGLSKVFESDADTIMKTTYVGTRGYQAPELLLDKPYDLSCDIFSAGVVLFILLTGYPPFEQAHASDRWFKSLIKCDYDKFWKSHRGCSIANDAKVKDLLQRMLAFDPKQRIAIADIKDHPWYLEKILEGKDLIRALRSRHEEMELKRRKDAGKVKDLQQSIKVNRNLPCPICATKDVKCNCLNIQLFPENEIESIVDTHTTAHWKDVVNKITEVVGKNGQVVLETTECKLICTLKVAPSGINENAQLIKFEVQIFKSREYDNRKYNEKDRCNCDDVYVVRMHRLEGDLIDYRKIKKYLFDTCADVLTGLPMWAIKLQEQKLIEDANVDNENDDYDDLLKNDWDLNDYNSNQKKVF